MIRRKTTGTTGRHRAVSRFRRSQAVATVGLAAVGLVFAIGPASADPTAADWAAIRQCESGGNYSINTGNGYYGAYQFDLSTWRSVGGSGYPHEASPAVQDEMALRLWRSRGWSPWACASMVSLSDGTAPPLEVASAPEPEPAPYAVIPKPTASDWVNEVYEGLLDRSGGATGASYRDQLAVGHNAIQLVTADVSTSIQRRQQYVIDAYRDCVGRAPSTEWLAARTAALATGTVYHLYESVCSSAESYWVAGGSMPQWILRTYNMLSGRTPSSAEVNRLAAAAQANGRAWAVRHMLQFSGWKERQVDAIYRDMLGRPATMSGKVAYRDSMLGRGQFRVPTILSTTPDFKYVAAK
ncbi:transglycosylase family protein [Nakamurella alba]|uniref:transglycosylase family protein n=1 Tax=Nakamurella alba TaxID=2665158 RepID=UPI002546466C|nr:transglycosylase family protein [Nakamurella alba]